MLTYSGMLQPQQGGILFIIITYIEMVFILATSVTLQQVFVIIPCIILTDTDIAFVPKTSTERALCLRRF